MQTTTEARVKQHYKSPRLPLAVYREVAAHLSQVTGVTTGLVTKPLKDGKESFDYAASQIAGLWIEHPQDLSALSKQQIQAILDYYGDRYQPWEALDKISEA